jgi:hypothetical protein
MIKKLEKMIETLNKINREGRDNELSRRLLRNLNEINLIIKSRELSKYVDVSDLESICQKQSMQSCIENAVKVLSKIEKRRLEKHLATAPASLQQDIADMGFDEDYE